MAILRNSSWLSSDIYESAIFGQKLTEQPISMEKGKKIVSADPPFVPCGHTVGGVAAEREGGPELNGCQGARHSYVRPCM